MPSVGAEPRRPATPRHRWGWVGGYGRTVQALAGAVRADRDTGQRLGLALRTGRLCAWEWDIRADRVRCSSEPAIGDETSRFAFTGDLAALLDRVHPEDRDGLADHLARAVRDRVGFDAGFRVVLPDGRTGWLQTAADVRTRWTGRPTHVVGVSQDHTEIKQSDQRLVQVEGRYRTLVEQLPLASYVEHLDGESAAYISPQIADLVGYTAEQWVGDPTFFASVLHPDDRDWVLAGFARMHETGEALECEYRLIAKDGQVVWIHDAAVVVRDDTGTPVYTQGYMIDISERKRNEEALRTSQVRLREQAEKAEYQALHDELTGLPNRTLMHDRVAQALAAGRRDGSPFGFMLIDLDRFKEVNDSLGHHSGDLLLREVANRLRAALRETDTVARLGGDEFAVLAPGLADATAACQLADKLCVELMRPVDVSGVTMEVEASIGIALYPDHGADVETLIRRADASMYVSKNSHAPTIYTQEFDNDSLDRLVLVGELRRALEHDELVVFYQPQATVQSGKIHKVEALVRWQHPERGLLGPDQFIPLAEQTGLIRAITRHVLDVALGQCRTWRDEGRELGVAVNITGRELLDLGFPDEVAGLLAKWALPATCLELEITENTIMTDPPRTRSILQRLRSLGVRLAIDDFGSGLSSLGYLKRLPIDIVKIDKSFVQNMATDLSDAAIVRSAIDMGRSLGLEVVAEGVENEDARQRLADFGCDTFQGYYLGRPQSAVTLFSEATPAPVA